ncbi:TrmH family RNA methyltransferase [Pontiella agarivorans]|uniref:RNA methyltransferase n=1 Tax=Pontiella agarivorans TaxID=3038953 RepID=A0ABU5MTN8_9BACT|nr:RNA methyltransferase [Pontiella agarivorans]MDZ8117451.1 RNA methyltransferase [Pontiella agarivorans]
MTREITSSTNPLIKTLRALITSKKARQESGRFIVEGWRGIKTLLEHESEYYTLEQLVVSNNWNQAPLPDTIEIISVPDHVFAKISDVRSAQGILGVVSKKNDAPDVPATGKFLLLDNLRDPGNLGTLIRSAVGAGFDGILLYGDCVEPENPKVIRSTMGTFAFSNLWNISRNELFQWLENGFELCVTTGLDGENLYESTFSEKTILVIGSEAHGVSDELFGRAAKKITIPLQPECESLNAAIAGSICMFHMQNSR